MDWYPDVVNADKKTRTRKPVRGKKAAARLGSKKRGKAAAEDDQPKEGAA